MPGMARRYFTAFCYMLVASVCGGFGLRSMLANNLWTGLIFMVPNLYAVSRLVHILVKRADA
jgi:hypothetical protein